MGSKLTYFEKLMFFYIIKFNSNFWVWNKYLIKKISYCLINLSIINRLGLIYFFINKLSCFSLKWRLSSNYLTNKNSKAPNINLIRVSLSSNYFRSYIGRCSANSKCFILSIIFKLL